MRLEREEKKQALVIHKHTQEEMIVEELNTLPAKILP